MRKFEMSPKLRAQVDRLIARAQVAKVEKRKAAWSAGHAKSKRRQQERKAARAETAMSGLVPRYGTNAERRILSLTGWKVLLARMEPDCWYTFGELRAMMPEYAPRSIDAWVRLERYARPYLERAGNPDFVPIGVGNPVVVPRYLYRVATEAASAAAGWRSDLGEG